MNTAIDNLSSLPKIILGRENRSYLSRHCKNQSDRDISAVISTPARSHSQPRQRSSVQYYPVSSTDSLLGQNQAHFARIITESTRVLPLRAQAALLASAKIASNTALCNQSPTQAAVVGHQSSGHRAPILESKRVVTLPLHGISKFSESNTHTQSQNQPIGRDCTPLLIHRSQKHRRARAHSPHPSFQINVPQHCDFQSFTSAAILSPVNKTAEQRKKSTRPLQVVKNSTAVEESQQVAPPSSAIQHYKIPFVRPKPHRYATPQPRRGCTKAFEGFVRLDLLRNQSERPMSYDSAADSSGTTFSIANRSLLKRAERGSSACTLLHQDDSASKAQMFKNLERVINNSKRVDVIPRNSSPLVGRQPARMDIFFEGASQAKPRSLPSSRQKKLRIPVAKTGAVNIVHEDAEVKENIENTETFRVITKPCRPIRGEVVQHSEPQEEINSPTLPDSVNVTQLNTPRFQENAYILPLSDKKRVNNQQNNSFTLNSCHKTLQRSKFRQPLKCINA